MEVVEDRGLKPPRDGELVPRETGFLVRLRSGLSERRRRFALAHEVCHTFFYQGGRHEVAILDTIELAAEERICNRFAGALLIPEEPLSYFLQQASRCEPHGFLDQLAHISGRFRVSVEALIARFRYVVTPGPSAFLLVFSYSENVHTGSDPRLRLRQFVSVGPRKGFWAPWNQSAMSLGVGSACALYEGWSRSSTHSSGRGSFVLDSDGRVDAGGASSGAVREEVLQISFCESHHWERLRIPVIAASVLYAPADGEPRDARIIVAARPTRPTDDREGQGRSGEQVG
jgi:hypothetical protein